MSGEPTTIRATVRAIDGQHAMVEVEQGGCGRCHEEGGCGGQNLTQMFCSGPRHYQAVNDIGAAVGERVTVAIAPGSVRQTANLAYILPLTVAIVGAALGMQVGGDPAAIVGALAGLVAAFGYLRLRGRQAGHAAAQPHIIARS